MEELRSHLPLWQPRAPGEQQGEEGCPMAGWDLEHL